MTMIGCLDTEQMLLCPGTFYLLSLGLMKINLL